MAEWRLYPNAEVPHVSTAEFHAHRERAAHLEQSGHRDRLLRAADFVLEACAVSADHWGTSGMALVSDLGCGDGGLLSLLKDKPQIRHAWGYDFAPSNQAGWAERGIEAYALDVFGADRDRVNLGDVVVLTEVLEHLADPHGVLRWILQSPLPDAVVASCPYLETPENHDECHAWAWDLNGFFDLFKNLGYAPQWHEIHGGSQIMFAVKPHMAEKP